MSSVCTYNNRSKVQTCSLKIYLANNEIFAAGSRTSILVHLVYIEDKVNNNGRGGGGSVECSTESEGGSCIKTDLVNENKIHILYFIIYIIHKHIQLV